MKIAIVEDELIFRDMLRKVCLAEPQIEVVVEAENGSAAVESILQTHPDAVMLDIMLPDIDGFDVLNRIRNRGQRPRVLVISSYLSPYLIYQIEDAGVDGFFDKRNQTIETLRAALNALRTNRPFFSDSFLRMKSDIRNDPSAVDKLLTRQQMIVLWLVAQEISDAAIAKHLGIEQRTVESHRTVIMRKLNLHSRMELVHYAHKQGFIFGRSSTPDPDR